MIDYILTDYDHTFPKANKVHSCCECLGEISKGENYHYHKGFHDGELIVHKVCNDCEDLKKELDYGLPIEEKTGFTYLWENVMESKEIFITHKWNNILKKRKSKLDPIKV